MSVRGAPLWISFLGMMMRLGGFWKAWSCFFGVWIQGTYDDDDDDRHGCLMVVFFEGLLVRQGKRRDALCGSFLADGKALLLAWDCFFTFDGRRVIVGLYNILQHGTGWRGKGQGMDGSFFFWCMITALLLGHKARHVFLVLKNPSIPDGSVLFSTFDLAL